MEITEEQVQNRLSKWMILLVVIQLSCQNVNKEHSLPKTEVSQKVPKVSHNSNVGVKQIIIDSTVNTIALSDASSVLKKAGDVSDLITQDYDKGECVTLLTKNQKEYFSMRREYGGYKNQYDYFYVGRITQKINGAKAKIIIDENFITNKGAILRMDQKSFLVKYADISFEKKSKGDTVWFEYYNDEELYQSKYVFVRDSLLKFEFGYQD